ncbi:MAG: serine--tRNA ligase [Candidatus Colwellbacteria bacterium]|nr:serine--tRNA ligase [Candidatus Colwellbacteria bacterium]
MIDIELIRQDPETVKKGIARKGVNPEIVDKFLALDERWRGLVKNLDDLRAKQKKLSESREISEAKKVKDEIQAFEATVREAEASREEVILQIPNPPLPKVPEGKDESENVVLREVGERRELDFEPKDHLALGQALDIIDFETGAKVTGSGFYYLKNEGVLLELALVRYALDFLSEQGFGLWLTPDLAREKFYLGTGYSPQGPEAQTYEIKDSDLGLIATAEVTLAGIHTDEIINEADLPKRYAGYSHCFRQEAGGYGKYSKGLYRVHQFTKVEMFAYAMPEDSAKIHEELLKNEEELWQSLGIPYRVVEMCAGDLGAQAARKFDLEAWMPGRPAPDGRGRGDWGEVTSTSNTTDYQARNLNIRLKRKDGKLEFAHTLNGTAIATSRAIIAILENYQTKDGSVVIPEALRPYVGKSEIRAKAA